MDVGQGVSLAAPLLAPFERHFATDFTDVRVHTDGQAARTAASLAADAFTVGLHIAFADGRFAPHTPAGRRLLAHELTHVVQQRSHPQSIARQADPEAEAARVDPSLYPQLRDEIDLATANLSQDDDVMLRASATRTYVLLTWLPRSALTTEQQLDDFIDNCKELAKTEIDTLKALGSGAEAFLAGYAPGFPLTWSGRVREALSIGNDLPTIFAEWLAEHARFLAAAQPLPGAIFEHGLPVPAADMARLAHFRLRISDRDFAGRSPVGDFAAEGVRHIQVTWVQQFAFKWEVTARRIADSVADGSVIANYGDWKDFVDHKQAILRALPDRARTFLANTDQQAQQFADSGLALADAALAVGMVSGLSGLVAILFGWGEVAELHDEKLSAADALVSNAGKGERIGKALTWAAENGYLGAALDQAIDALIASGPRILAELGVIMVANMIPGVNIAVDVYLAFKLGLDAISMFVDLVSAFGDVMDATSVGSLQAAARRLSVVLVNGGMQILMVLVTVGVAKTSAKIRGRAAAIRSAEPAVSEEVASRRAFDELSPQERAPLETGAAKQAKEFAQAQAKAHEPSSFPTAERTIGPLAPVAARDAAAGVTSETQALFGKRPELKRALDAAPRAARALRKCASFCYPDFATPSQIDRLERILDNAESEHLHYDPTRLTNYLRGMKNWTEFDLALTELARDVERKLGVRAIQEEAAKLGPDASPAGRPATTVLRSQPGVGTGGESLPRAGSDWFPKTELGATDVRVAPIPGQLAARLRNMHFDNFDAFRETFWRMVANDRQLSRAFDYYPENIGRMRSGLAPWVPSRRVGAARVESVGGGANAVYQLNHRLALKNTGGVYDMDNIEVVTPKFHGEIGD